MMKEILKYICCVVAIFSTCLYISNIITDINATTSWKNNLQFGDSKDIDNTTTFFAKFRLILSIIMSLSWGAVIML